MITPRFPLRAKLIISFSIVIIIGVFLSTIIGIRLIGSTIIRQAQDKVRLDLNTAREIYHEEAAAIKTTIRLTASRFFIKDALKADDLDRLREELQKIRRDESLDVLAITDRRGRVLVRAHNQGMSGDRPNDDLVGHVIANGEPVVATQILSAEDLEAVGDEYLERARMPLISTLKARSRVETEERSGMFIKAAAPVFDYGGNFVAVLYGGNMLNRNYDIVDKVKNIVYMGERYKGRDIGTATIFLGDARISTNVMDAAGGRAIGTRVSEEVYEQVMLDGMPWVGRAFVVNAWYMTAYEPIRNIGGSIIGMLYVGMLEAPYIDLRNQVVVTFWSIAALSVVLLSVIAHYTTSNIVKPVKVLAQATESIAHGELSHRVHIATQDEIGLLADSFNRMIAALQEATDSYRSLTNTLEERVAEKTKELEAAQEYLIQSEKLASLGKLAAGVAHEINNPLTSILMNSHLSLEKLEDEVDLKENLQLIIDETTRCSSIVSGLLEFARQTPPEKTVVDVNELIESTLLIMDTQVMVHKVRVIKHFDKSLPHIRVDVNKMKQVFTNLILNALEAMPERGILKIVSQLSQNEKNVEMKFEDNGKGITKENLTKIFDPFFSTKGMKGTGLGLSISYGIVQQHGGTIYLDSEVGRGTTVIMSLPLYETVNEKKEEKSG